MALSAQVLDDLEAVRALKAEWTELAGRASAYSAGFGFDYATLAWDALARQPGDRLAVVTVRDAGRLAGLWPLFVREEPRKSVARHLGNGSDEEYAAPLIAAGPDEAAIAARLLAQARRLADLLIVRNLPVLGVMALAVTAAGGLQHRWDDTGSVISLAGAESFEAWVAPKSKPFRYDLRNDRRKLASLGVLESRVMTGPADGPRFADWLFATKRAWAAERGLTESWLYGDQGRDHLAALLAGSPDAFGQAILLDDQIIAGGSVVVSRGRLEFFVTAFDPAHASCRPGNLLNEDLARRAIAMGLDLDFRMMPAGYKDRWADRKEPIASFWLANSLKGAVAVLAQRIRVRLRR
jgi:CelD/BcsL family acetyltransferase involved in cellulose biosynthesis